MTTTELRKNIELYFSNRKEFCKASGYTERAIIKILNSGKINKKQENCFKWVFHQAGK